MKVFLTSSGIETRNLVQEVLKQTFKYPDTLKVLFIPTAAIDPDSIEMLPKCLNDLYRCGIQKENITVYTMHYELEATLSSMYDIIYITGGNTQYLLNRVREKNFHQRLLQFIEEDGILIGVSAGSIIFADNLDNNLELIPTRLEVHVDPSIATAPGVHLYSDFTTIYLKDGQALIPGENVFTIIE